MVFKSCSIVSDYDVLCIGVLECSKVVEQSAEAGLGREASNDCFSQVKEMTETFSEIYSACLVAFLGRPPCPINVATLSLKRQRAHVHYDSMIPVAYMCAVNL